MLIEGLANYGSSQHAGREGKHRGAHLMRGLEHHVCPEKAHTELPNSVGLLAHCSDRHCMGKY